ncbi:MAG: hypothetical protein RI953_2752 [Pseudomonadota bacterium]|jgi:hypothetical protein
MRTRKTPFSFSLVLLVMCASVEQPVLAGSNNGSLATNSGFSCDNRADLKKDFQLWCTAANAQLIRSQCFAVVHMDTGVQRCGWQGCGFFSFVGQKPSLSGEMVVEYGISTPHGLTTIPASWQQSGNQVLPQSPYPRTYLTVDQFLTVRSGCKGPKSNLNLDPAVVDRICGIGDSSLDLSPYYVCMKAQKLVP